MFTACRALACLTVVLLMLPAAAVNAQAVTLTGHLDYPADHWNPDYREYLTEPTRWLRDDWRQSLFVPDFPGLRTTAREIEDMLRLMPSRAAAQAAIDEEISFDGLHAGFFKALRGVDYDRDALRRFLDIVFDDATYAVFYFKDRFNRARPWHYYPALAPVIAPPGHPSYPSGHATQGFALAFALSEVFPELRIAFEQYAYQLARHREIGGVHYRSDSLAGELLAHQLVTQMRRHPEFQALKAAIRAR